PTISPTGTFSFCELLFSPPMHSLLWAVLPRSGYNPRLGTGTEERHIMNQRVLRAVFLALFGLAAIQGCQHQRPRPCPPAPCGPAGNGAVLSAPPPGALTAPPAGAVTVPPGSTFVPPAVPAPGAPPVDVRRYEPPVASAEPPMWKPPASPGV